MALKNPRPRSGPTRGRGRGGAGFVFIDLSVFLFDPSGGPRARWTWRSWESRGERLRERERKDLQSCDSCEEKHGKLVKKVNRGRSCIFVGLSTP